MMKEKFKLSAGFIVLSILMIGCGQLAVGIETPAPSPSPEPTLTPAIPTEAPTGEPTMLPVTEDPATPDPESEYWVESGDTRTGIRFAVPCFWSVNVPTGEQDPSGLGSFPIQNFTPAFVESFGPKGGDLIWENGAVKADIVYFVPEDWNLQPDLSLEEFAHGLYPDSETSELELVSTESMQINGQESLLLTTRSKSNGDLGKFYLFQLNRDLYMGFSPVPVEAVEHPDIQAILQSLALTPETPVRIPGKTPEAPPDGVDALCMGFMNQPDGTAAGDPDCTQVTEDRRLDWVQCNIQDGLRSGNTAALLSFMKDQMVVGYWRSESQVLSPEQFHTDLTTTRLPQDKSGLTFTIDRGLFPALDGTAPEMMFNPDVPIARIIYSEGWGLDGQGAAMIYIAMDAQGDFYWYGTVLAFDHFE
jgi:hypothetical protein